MRHAAGESCRHRRRCASGRRPGSGLRADLSAGPGPFSGPRHRRLASSRRDRLGPRGPWRRPLRLHQGKRRRRLPRPGVREEPDGRRAGRHQSRRLSFLHALPPGRRSGREFSWTQSANRRRCCRRASTWSSAATADRRPSPAEFARRAPCVPRCRSRQGSARPRSSTRPTRSATPTATRCPIAAFGAGRCSCGRTTTVGAFGSTTMPGGSPVSPSTTDLDVFSGNSADFESFAKGATAGALSQRGDGDTSGGSDCRRTPPPVTSVTWRPRIPAIFARAFRTGEELEGCPKCRGCRVSALHPAIGGSLMLRHRIGKLSLSAVAAAVTVARAARLGHDRRRPGGAVLRLLHLQIRPTASREARPERCDQRLVR